MARTPAKARPLEATRHRAAASGWRYARGRAAPRSADLLISTVTPGAADDLAETAGGSAPVVLDVDLRPVADGAGPGRPRRRRTVVGGLDLLVGQALLQIELMTGNRCQR